MVCSVKILRYVGQSCIEIASSGLARFGPQNEIVAKYTVIDYFTKRHTRRIKSAVLYLNRDSASTQFRRLRATND